jgi:hypothetical protein
MSVTALTACVRSASPSSADNPENRHFICLSKSSQECVFNAKEILAPSRYSHLPNSEIGRCPRRTCGSVHPFMSSFPALINDPSIDILLAFSIRPLQPPSLRYHAYLRESQFLPKPVNVDYKYVRSHSADEYKNKEWGAKKREGNCK